LENISPPSASRQGDEDKISKEVRSLLRTSSDSTIRSSVR